MNIIDYLRVLRRRWPIILIASLIGLSSGLLISPGRSGEEGFTATATLLQAPEVEQFVESTALVVTSDSVAERAALALGSSRAPQELSAAITSTGDSNTNAITVVAAGADPEDAVNLANAFATAAVDEFRDRIRISAEARLQVLQSQLAEVDDQLGLDIGVPPIDGLTSEQRLELARADALGSRYAEIYGQIQETTTLAANPSGLEVLSPAVTAGADSSAFSLSSTPVRTLVGLVLGLGLGVGLVLAMAQLDTRPRERETASKAYGFPVLVEVPEIGRRDRGGFSVITRSQPGSPAAEAYRSLRSSLMFMRSRLDRPSPNGVKPPQVILVASARAAEGKTVTTVNLAACLAEAGKRVLVLDCDFRGPDAHAYLDVGSGTGLSNLLTAENGVNLVQYVRTSGIPGVSVVSAGTALQQPTVLPAQMGEVIRQARALADFVLVDSAPMLLANDAMDLMPHVDTVLVVSYAGRATEEQARRAGELLTRMRVAVAGIALVGVRGISIRQLRSYSSVPKDPQVTTRLPAVPIRPNVNGSSSASVRQQGEA